MKVQNTNSNGQSQGTGLFTGNIWLDNVQYLAETAVEQLRPIIDARKDLGADDTERIFTTLVHILLDAKMAANPQYVSRIAQS